jgi:hypothetical protein
MTRRRCWASDATPQRPPASAAHGPRGLDLQALELQAGLALDGADSSPLGLQEQEWREVLEGFRLRLQLLRLVANVRRWGLRLAARRCARTGSVPCACRRARALLPACLAVRRQPQRLHRARVPSPPTQVWNREDPCILCGFDLEPLGAAQALARQPAGTTVCCFAPEQPDSIVLLVKQHAPGAAGAAAGGGAAGGSSPSAAAAAAAAAGAAGASDGSSGGDAGDAGDGVLRAVLTSDDLMQRRLEAWLRDLPAATHVLDVYRGKRTAKAAVLGSDKFTRLRALDPLDAYDDIFI